MQTQNVVKLFVLFYLNLSVLHFACGQQEAEELTRGVVAVRSQPNSAFVSWRLLEKDPEGTTFNIYRTSDGGKPVKLNKKPLEAGTNYLDEKVDFSKTNTWKVLPLINGKEQEEKSEYKQAANTPVGQYITVPLQTPEGYTPNDGSVGDLNGDGQFEIVIHQNGKGHDNSHKGFTDDPDLQAYKLDGTLLWTINLGKNIREGAHYTQFIVYDLDGDGKAEVAVKTADGTIDGVKGRRLAYRTWEAANARARPISRNIRGVSAPSQIGMSCVGDGPRCAPSSKSTPTASMTACSSWT